MSDFDDACPEDALDAHAIRVGKGKPLDLAHEVASPAGNPLERLLSLESVALVQRRLDKLPLRDAAFLQTRYGFEGEEKTLKATGEAVGGVSAERVRQRESKALRSMRWHPRELNELDGVPSVSAVSGRLENIVVLANKIPLVIQGWMKNGIETTDQLETTLKKAVPSARGHVVNLGFSDLLSGKVFRSDAPAGKVSVGDDQTFLGTATPTRRYSQLFEASCALAGVPLENAFDRPLVPLGSVKFGRAMAEQKTAHSMKPGP